MEEVDGIAPPSLHTIFLLPKGSAYEVTDIVEDSFAVWESGHIVSGTLYRVAQCGFVGDFAETEPRDFSGLKDFLRERIIFLGKTNLI